MDVADVGPYIYRNRAHAEADSPPGVTYGSRETSSKYYDFGHAIRGTALIFNHTDYDPELNNESRDGSDKDSKDLERVLKILKFDVVLCQNYTKAQIHKMLEYVARLDHSTSDCLMVILMTHGKANGEVYAQDSAYQVSSLWNSFAGISCPTLIGKPKLFFVQACRGRLIDHGVAYNNVQIETDSGINQNGETFVIPTLADILIMYSTIDGHFSYRSPIQGSWFIQELCKQLETNHKSSDLLSMLTHVIGSVAYGQQVMNPNSPIHAAKQLPHINSQLTKVLYFGQIPKLRENRSGEWSCPNVNIMMWTFGIILIFAFYAMMVPFVFCDRK